MQFEFEPAGSPAIYGEIEVGRNLSETAQRQKVASIEMQWREAQPTIEGEKVLLSGYESHTLDTSREIQ